MRNALIQAAANLPLNPLIYNGEVPLITTAALRSLVGLSAGNQLNANPGFLHFTHEGKELFVAKMVMSRSVSWNQLNAAGIVAGKVITIGGKQYLCRLMRGATANPAVTAGGEWDQLIYAVCRTRPASYQGPQLAEYTVAQLGVGTEANPMSTLCQETMANTSANACRRGRDGLTYFSGLQKIDAGTLVGWRPLLEQI